MQYQYHFFYHNYFSHHHRCCSLRLRDRRCFRRRWIAFVGWLCYHFGPEPCVLIRFTLRCGSDRHQEAVAFGLAGATVCGKRGLLTHGRGCQSSPQGGCCRAVCLWGDPRCSPSAAERASFPAPTPSPLSARASCAHGPSSD